MVVTTTGISQTDQVETSAAFGHHLRQNTPILL